MNILLIYPYFIEDRVHREEIAAVPIGLYSVGAVLRQAGYPVQILDWHATAGKRRLMERTLRAMAPDVIGFSILHANRWGGIEIARLAKRIDSRVRIVFGGIGATFLWEHLLTHFPEIDYVVRGEGEYPFLRLVQRLERRTPGPPEEVRGLAFRRHGRPVSTPDAEPIADLDALPDPARYFTFRHLILSRGCPGGCSFCGSPEFWGRRVRWHSAEYFVDQVERLYSSGIRFLHVSDDTFTLDRRRVIEVCRRLIARELDLTWAAISRVNCVDAEVLGWMRRAGCIQVSYGVESGAAEIRRRLCKQIETADVLRAFDLTQRCGMLARAYFIYGSPGENWDTIGETLDLIEAIRPLGAIFYILDIFPGTRLYADYQRRCGVTDDIWLERIEDILYFETDPDLDREQVLAFGRKLRASYRSNLSRYALAVELNPEPQFASLQADFLSRLGLTFHQGDYARFEEIRDAEKTAEVLYRRALDLNPDARAAFGLGSLLQKRGDAIGSERVLAPAAERFPDHPQLAFCLAVSRMNQGRYRAALEGLKPFVHLPEAQAYMTQCRQELKPT